MVKFGIVASGPNSQETDLQSDVAGNLKVAGTYNSFSNGQTSITSTAVQLTTASTPALFGVIIKALNANTDKVYVGNSSSVSSSNGYEIGAGENISIPMSNANIPYLIAASGTQTVCWVAI